MRLNKVLRELNISLDRAVEYLAKNGHEIDARPTTKISSEIYQVLQDGFQTDANKKAASKEVGEEKRKEKEAIRIELDAKIERKRLEAEKKEEVLKAKAEKLQIKTVGKIDIAPKKALAKPAPISVETPKATVKEEKPAALVKEEKPATKVEEKKPEEAPKVEKKVTEVPSKKVLEEKQEVLQELKEESIKVEKEKPATKAKEDASVETSETSEVSETIKTQYKKLNGPKLTGKIIDLKQFDKLKKKP
jgi:translation initiation factor IF-2